jgi:hypothetical protein
MFVADCKSFVIKLLTKYYLIVGLYLCLAILFVQNFLSIHIDISSYLNPLPDTPYLQLPQTYILPSKVRAFV